MYAIIETGGKQYKVQEGDVIYVEKLDAVAGTPVVAGAKVTGTVEKHGKGRKIIVFKYKPKKNYRRKQGHRQPYTKVTIAKIEA